MPTIVIADKCDGCRGKSESMCEQICPMDIMRLDPTIGKAINISPKDCWDCMACVKACPNQAIQTKLPYQIAAYGAKLVPLISGTTILWTLTYADGTVRQISKPIRRTEDDEE